MSKVLLHPQFVVTLVRHSILGVADYLWLEAGATTLLSMQIWLLSPPPPHWEPHVFYPRRDNYLLQVCNKLTTPALLFLPNIHARFILVYDHNYAMLSFTMCNTEYFGFKVIKPKTWGLWLPKFFVGLFHSIHDVTTKLFTARGHKSLLSAGALNRPACPLHDHKDYAAAALQRCCCDPTERLAR